MPQKNIIKNILIIITLFVTVVLISIFINQLLNSSKNNVENKNKVINSDQPTPISSTIYGQYTIKFSEIDYNLNFVGTINDGLAMYYVPKGENVDSKSKLIINQYGNKISAKDLSNGILNQSKENGDELLSPFTAPDKQERESYYITTKTAGDYYGENTIISIIKVFEDNGSTYSIIYQQKIVGRDKEDVKNIADKWIIENLEKIGSAIENIDLAVPVSFYNANKEIFNNLSKSNKYASLKWKTETIKENNNYADIKLEYPVFIGGGEVSGLNKYIKDIIDKNLSSDKQMVAEWLETEKMGIGIGGEELTDPFCVGAEEYHIYCSVNLYSTFEINSIINDIVSLELVISDYTGGGNGNHSNSVTINYDLKSDKELQASELFCNSDYANELFKLAEIDLPNQYSYLEAGTIFDNGTPKADNFKNVLLNGSGFVLVFQPYDITPGAVGIPKVFIPYSSVSNLICLP